MYNCGVQKSSSCRVAGCPLFRVALVLNGRTFGSVRYIVGICYCGVFIERILIKYTCIHVVSFPDCNLGRPGG